MKTERIYEARRFLSMDTEFSVLAKVLGKRFPEDIKILKEVDDFVNNFEFNTDEFTSELYKTNSGHNKSIEIHVSKTILSYIKSGADCSIKRRILTLANESPKVKSSYIKKGNSNFITMIKSDSELSFAYLSESNFKKAVTSIKKILLYRALNSYNLSSKLPKLSNEARNIIGGIDLNDFGRSIYSSISRLPIQGNIVCYGKQAYLSIIQGLLNTHMIGSKAKLTSILSNIFDVQSRNEELILKNTRTERYSEKNPVSNFLTLKSRRIILDECPNKEYIETIMKDDKNIVEFLSEVSRVIEKETIKFNAAGEYSVKVIEPGTISALYNVSSYYGSAYNVDSSDSPMGKNPGGTLFNSCMRRPSSKYDTSFYDGSGYNKLLVVSDLNNKKIKARAVIWYDKEKDINYVDRVYYTDDKQVAIMAKFIESNPNFYIIHCSWFGHLGEKKRVESMIIKVNPVEMSTGVPYLDSMSCRLFKKDSDYYICSKSASLSSSFHDTNIALNKWKKEKENGTFKLIEKEAYCTRCGFNGPVRNFIKINGEFECTRHYKKTEEDNIYSMGNSYLLVTDSVPKERKKLYTSFDGTVISSEFASNYHNPVSSLLSFISRKGVRYMLSHEVDPTILLKVEKDNEYRRAYRGSTSAANGVVYDNRKYRVLSTFGLPILFPVNPSNDDYRLLNLTIKLELSAINRHELKIKNKIRVAALSSAASLGDLNGKYIDLLDGNFISRGYSFDGLTIQLGEKLYPLVSLVTTKSNRIRLPLDAVIILEGEDSKLELNSRIDEWVKQLKEGKQDEHKPI